MTMDYKIEAKPTGHFNLHRVIQNAHNKIATELENIYIHVE
jgi:hypothetical protein